MAKKVKRRRQTPNEVARKKARAVMKVRRLKLARDARLEIIAPPDCVPLVTHHPNKRTVVIAPVEKTWWERLFS